MKLGKILKSVGKNLVKNVVPGADIIFDTLEDITGKKLFDRDNATGEDVTKAINFMSSQDQMMVLTKEFDVEIVEEQEWTKRFEAANKADETGKSTRPEIAKMVAFTVCLPVNLFSVALFFSALMDKKEMVDSLSNCSMIVISITTPLLALLYAYFGMRTREKQSRYNMAVDQPAPTGIIGSLVNLIKK